jgi:hypothetical protein
VSRDFAKDREKAEYQLRSIMANVIELQRVLSVAKTVRTEDYGVPPWVSALERGHDEIAKALAAAMWKATF